MNHELIDLHDIAAMMGITHDYLRDRIIKRKDFPKPTIRLSQKVKRWNRQDIILWLEQQA